MRTALRRWCSGEEAPAFAGESRANPFGRPNQDRILMRPGLAAVADGLGGHADGDSAAEAIVAALEALPAPDERSVRAALHACDQALRTANGAPSGATTAILLWDEARLTCLWAGDCRVYRWRDGTLAQLTRDHRLVQQLIDAGALSPAEARMHPHASVVTSAIGAGACEIASASGDIADDDRFLICSDGLSDVVGDAEIAACLAAPAPEAAVTALHAAAQPFARDDVSVIVVDATPR